MKIKTTKEGEKHFTVSSWLITASEPRRVLLIFHKKFNKWIQPGGHIEEFENPIEAVARETLEETGIDISFMSKQVDVVDDDGKFLPVPDFFMEQTIPLHKNEPLHYHLDSMYVVEIDEQKLNPSLDESQKIGWFTKEEVENLHTHLDTKIIVRKIL